MNDTDRLAELVRKHPAGLAVGFRPCAFYDDRLDCIRVVARDCSVVEERLNDRITVLVDSYHPRGDEPDDFEYVSFTIKGARHFCRQHGFSTRTIKMTSLLDALLKEYPELVVRMFVQLVARPIVEQQNIRPGGHSRSSDGTSLTKAGRPFGASGRPRPPHCPADLGGWACLLVPPLIQRQPVHNCFRRPVA